LAGAAKLGVANILTGSVRLSPETIRVSAQLVSGADGVERWAQSYDRAPGDAIKIQTDIAQNVAQALSIELSQAGLAALTLGGTADAVAQDLVLQSRKVGRETSSAESYRQRLALAEAAIARDPNYADAYVQKANALGQLADFDPVTSTETAKLRDEAEAAARKALALAPRLGSAHAMLCEVALIRMDFQSASRELQEALALSPEDPFVLAYGGILASFGRGAEGLKIADSAIALDPLNGRAYWNKAVVLFMLRRYPEAVQTGRKALTLAPHLEGAHMFIGHALLLLGRFAEAKAEYEAIGSDDPLQLASLGLLAARKGERAHAETVIAQLRRKAGAGASYQYAEIYAQLGDIDRAFAELDNAVRAKDSGLSLLKVDPFLDPIRGGPRYAALLRTLNFP
jgi:serine/threonine-protein kinase